MRAAPAATVLRAGGTFPFGSVQVGPGFYRQFGKRGLDLLLGLALLPGALLLGLLLTPLLRRDGGPALFAQTRIGRGGQPFRCWKFRTMLPDSDRLLAEHLRRDPLARAEWEAQRKLSHDPRITPLGRLLRRTSLDEVPQLWNILRGEMSLVGPRPVPADELDRYGPFRAHYLALRPGLTGLWQVSGRHRVSYRRRVRMDVDYALSLSFTRDLALIVRTVGVVFARTGQ